MLFNTTSIVYWHVITANKQQQFVIDNDSKKPRQVSYDCAIGDLLYVDNNVIYHSMDDKKHGPYRITEVLKNSTV